MTFDKLARIVSLSQHSGCRFTDASTTVLDPAASTSKLFWRSALRRVFLLAGSALFVMLLWKTGLDSIRILLFRIGWAFPILFLPHFLLTIFEASGWWLAFPRKACRVKKIEILRFSIAAKAIQLVTPSIAQAGELLKFHLLRLSGISAEISMASVVAAKTTITLAEVVFIGLGFAGMLSYIKLEPLTAISLSIGVLTMCVTVVGLLVWQRMGFFRLLVLAGRRFSALANFFERYEAFLSSTDSMLREFIGERGRFCLSALVYFCAWLAGALEAWLFLKIVGLPGDPISALLIQAWLVLVTRLTAFVPANLGTHEAGALMIFSLLGFSAEGAIGFALLRRIRQIFWVALGLSILAKTPRAKHFAAV